MKPTNADQKGTKMKENTITGHFTELSSEDWLEACASYIASAKRYIARAKRGVFGRDYLLMKAGNELYMAERCRVESIIQTKIIFV
jgi:hypothetical protein